MAMGLPDDPKRPSMFMLLAALGGLGALGTGHIPSRPKQYYVGLGAPPREERKRKANSPTGRNGKCACGSGKKAKKCCY